MSIDYKNKYIKYKQKYDLLYQIGGYNINILYICNSDSENESSNSDIKYILEKDTTSDKSIQNIDNIKYSDIIKIIGNDKKYNYIFFIMCDTVWNSESLIKDINSLIKILEKNGIIYFKTYNKKLIDTLKVKFSDPSFKIIDLPQKEQKLQNLDDLSSNQRRPISQQLLPRDTDVYRWQQKGKSEMQISSQLYPPRDTDVYRWQFEGPRGWHFYSKSESDFIDRRITEGRHLFSVNVIDHQTSEPRTVYINTKTMTQSLKTDNKSKRKFRKIRKIKYSDDTSQQYSSSSYSYKSRHNMTTPDRTLIMIETTTFLGKNNWGSLVRIAEHNLSECKVQTMRPNFIFVEEGDWGAITAKYTKIYCQKFAVLNMANGDHFGGGYKTGAPAQEENLMRRTTCSLDKYGIDYKRPNEGYSINMSNRVNGKAPDGLVYLNKQFTHVCFRDTEENGYKFLNQKDYFPFYELRSAAFDARRGGFTEADCQRRINAQFNTLIHNGIKHVILSAFGCGAFQNPPQIVANCYKRAIEHYIRDFDAIIFAIYTPSRDDPNIDIFKRILSEI